MDNRHVDVTLSLRIWDVEAFVRAAQERAIEEGVDEDDALATYNEDDLPACACMLFDPGTGPAGCEILSSDGELDITLDEPEDEEDDHG